jgi:hypothetical protein
MGWVVNFYTLRLRQAGKGDLPEHPVTGLYFISHLEAFAGEPETPLSIAESNNLTIYGTTWNVLPTFAVPIFIALSIKDCPAKRTHQPCNVFR